LQQDRENISVRGFVWFAYGRHRRPVRRQKPPVHRRI